MGELGAFLVVAALVIVTPGQDTALTIRNTLVGGRRAGVGTALGVASGQAVWTVAASAGLAALLVASEPVFTALRLAGAGYLVYLGLHALLEAMRPGQREPVAPARAAGRALPAAVAFRHGLVSNLGNAKMAVFFTSLLPQFALGDGFAVLLGLGLLFCAMTLLWLSAYALAVDRAGRLLRRAPVRRVLDAASGAVLVALGIRLLVEPSGRSRA
jgi:threonine/homoserine/homoserine lactone efflux protein